MPNFAEVESLLAKLTLTKRQGKIFVVSGPSGVGKTILCNRAVKEIPNLAYSISHTTRPRRANEQHGREYFFVTKEAFEEKIQRGEFLEWAQVHGNLYGTSIDYIQQMTSRGIDVIMDIDVQGGQQVQQKPVDNVLIFIVPPSMEELQNRLFKRNTDKAEHIQQRLETACEEISQYSDYNYLIVNRVLDDAALVLKSIIIAERHRIGG